MTSKTKKQVLQPVKPEVHLSEEEEEPVDEEEEEEEEDEVEEEATASQPTKEKQHKLSSSELFDIVMARVVLLENAENEFREQTKAYEVYQKNFFALYKKTTKEAKTTLEKLGKHISTESGKKKPRKTGNSGQGGFNKKTTVPDKLKEYIGIAGDELMSRPDVTKLLRAKFADNKLVKEKEENGKTSKIIVFDKSAAEKLHVKKGDTILCKDMQTFIKKFYDELKTETIDA
jgi:hypothetical protein